MFDVVSYQRETQSNSMRRNEDIVFTYWRAALRQFCCYGTEPGCADFIERQDSYVRGECVDKFVRLR